MYSYYRTFIDNSYHERYTWTDQLCSQALPASIIDWHVKKSRNNTIYAITSLIEIRIIFNNNNNNKKEAIYISLLISSVLAKPKKDLQINLPFLKKKDHLLHYREARWPKSRSFSCRRVSTLGNCSVVVASRRREARQKAWQHAAGEATACILLGTLSPEIQWEFSRNNLSRFFLLQFNNVGQFC